MVVLNRMTCFIQPLTFKIFIGIITQWKEKIKNILQGFDILCLRELQTFFNRLPFWCSHLTPITFFKIYNERGHGQESECHPKRAGV